MGMAQSSHVQTLCLSTSLRHLCPHLGQHRLITRQIGVADRFVNGDDLFDLIKANQPPEMRRRLVGLYSDLLLSSSPAEVAALPLWHKAETIPTAHNIAHAGEGQVGGDNF
jgi:hypothetical protein